MGMGCNIPVSSQSSFMVIWYHHTFIRKRLFFHTTSSHACDDVAWKNNLFLMKVLLSWCLTTPCTLFGSFKVLIVPILIGIRSRSMARCWRTCSCSNYSRKIGQQQWFTSCGIELQNWMLKANADMDSTIKLIVDPLKSDNQTILQTRGYILPVSLVQQIYIEIVKILTPCF